MPVIGLVVVHRHGVEPQHHHHGLLDPQPPRKQPLEHSPEQPHPAKRERPEEPLDGVRGGHLVGSGLDPGGVACVNGQLVEVGEVAATAIEQEAEHLLEQLGNRQPLAAAAQGAEQSLQMRLDLNVAQIAHEQGQPTTPGQLVRRGANVVDLKLSVARYSGRCQHGLAPFGLGAASAAPVIKLLDLNNLTHRVLSLYPENRSI